MLGPQSRSTKKDFSLCTLDDVLDSDVINVDSAKYVSQPSLSSLYAVANRSVVLSKNFCVILFAFELEANRQYEPSLHSTLFKNSSVSILAPKKESRNQRRTYIRTRCFRDITPYPRRNLKSIHPIHLLDRLMNLL